MAVSRVDLAKIHIAKKELGLDDDTYRDLLTWKFKVSSAKDLKPRQVAVLLNHFKASGWKPKYKRSKKSKTAKKGKITANTDQDKKIRAMWITMHKAGEVLNPSEQALAQYVRRMTRVARLEWCSPEQKVLVIEALKKWQTRDLFDCWLFKQWLLDGSILVDVETKGLIWR